jgi:hypothetical protein
MDPCAIHPVVHGGPADSRDQNRVADRRKFRFLVTMLAEKNGHNYTAIRTLELARQANPDLNVIPKLLQVNSRAK